MNITSKSNIYTAIRISFQKPNLSPEWSIQSTLTFLSFPNYHRTVLLVKNDSEDSVFPDSKQITAYYSVCFNHNDTCLNSEHLIVHA